MYLKILAKNEPRKTNDDNIRIERLLYLYQNLNMMGLVNEFLHSVADTVNPKNLVKIMEIKFSFDYSLVFTVSSAYLIDFKKDSIYSIYKTNMTDSGLKQVSDDNTKNRLQKMLSPVLNKYKIDKSYVNSLFKLLLLAYDKRKRIDLD